MKDKKETRGDARWQALAESLRSDDEPPRQAEVIRAQFRPKTDIDRDQGTTHKDIPAPDQAHQPASKKLAGDAQSADGMSRPELIAYLRSALDTLEQSRAAQGEPTTTEPDPDRLGQSQSSGKQVPRGDRTDLPVSSASPIPKDPGGVLSEGPTGEPRPKTSILRGSEDSAATAGRVGAKATHLLFADEQPSTSDTPEPARRQLEPSDDRDSSDLDTTGDGQSEIPASTPRLQFSQEVPDFLRSRDIKWPGTPGPARQDRGATQRGRLETLYPGQIPDPREAPPPWVRNKNNQTRSRRRARIVSVSAGVAVVLTLALGTTWIVTRSEASARVLLVESIQSWLYRAGSSAATGARETGAVIQALLPFGDDTPSIQSIVLLPKSGQQPSIQIPPPEPSPRTVAIPIRTDTGAATELPSVAYEDVPSKASESEAFVLTIKPASNLVAGSQQRSDNQPIDGTQVTAATTLSIVAAEKTSGLAERTPPPPDRGVAEIATSPARADTEAVVRRDLILLSNSPNQQRAPEQPPAPVVDATVVTQLAAAPQPETEVPIAEPPETTAAIVANIDLPAPPLENWRVQLASLGDGASAQTEWLRLRQIHPALLADQPLHVEQVELDTGTFYRIQVGSFASIASAQNLCNGLKTRGQDCLVVR